MQEIDINTQYTIPYVIRNRKKCVQIVSKRTSFPENGWWAMPIQLRIPTTPKVQKNVILLNKLDKKDDVFYESLRFKMNYKHYAGKELKRYITPVFLEGMARELDL